MSKNALSLRLRDAWRVLQGKPIKYTSSLGGLKGNAQTSNWILSKADELFIHGQIETISKSKQPIIVIGGKDSRLLYAVVAWKDKSQVLDIVIDQASNFNHGGNVFALPFIENDESIRLHNVVDLSGLKFCEKSPPGLVILNQELPAPMLEEILEHAKNAGCESFLGWGYSTQAHAIMQVVHKHLTVESSDNLWRIEFSKPEKLDPNESTSRSPCPQLRVISDDREGLVSIVIPAYESRPYIQEAFDDIALQTYKNWELLVVEDAAPNSIVDLVVAFQQKVPHNRVVFHRKEHNSGASSTRNVAMKMAQGQYISFLDSDDRWLPDHLSRKVNLLSQSRADIVYSGVDMFDSDSGRSEFIWGPNSEELDHFPNSLFIRNFIQPSGVLIRQSVVEDVGLFDESIFLVEDYDYWLRSVRQGKIFVYDPKVTTRYRKNHASASTTGRMVLCYDGVARVAFRNGDLLKDVEFRKHVLTKHLVTAAFGHLGYAQSSHNRCSPKIGYDLLKLACSIDETKWDAKRWAHRAWLAMNSGTIPAVRGIFRKQYRTVRHIPVDLNSLCKAA
ncbi:MAG: glycosyltransferase [Planctomycetota bacterium]|nr:glycosyltransferase [Planctomycetota bacterium]